MDLSIFPFSNEALGGIGGRCLLLVLDVSLDVFEVLLVMGGNEDDSAVTKLRSSIRHGGCLPSSVYEEGLHTLRPRIVPFCAFYTSGG